MSDSSSPAHDPSMARYGRDLLASLVVFLVALPLSLGIALASGAPIQAGIVSAVVGGVLVGALSGSPLQVSGPAAGLAVMVFGIIRAFGFEVACTITLLAGLLQLAFGLARVASVALAISPAVIHGMLAGIGVQIALAQLHVVFGGAPESSALRNLMALPEQLANLHGGATALGVVTIVLVVLWAHVSVRPLRLVPPPLVAVAVVTLTAEALGIDAPRVTLPSNPLSVFSLPRLPALSQLGAVLLAAVTMALVASAESLLCALATDKLHRGPRADLDRELVAQGVGNLVAGLVGGLPITGVIVRSSANIAAGAQTRLAAVMHGVWVVLFVSFLGSMLTRIPLAVLAGLLVVIGVRLVDVAHIRSVRRHGEAPVYLATLVGVLVFNLLAGIGLGVGMAVWRLLRRLTQLSVQIESLGECVHVTVHGAATFVGVPRLTTALSQVPPGTKVQVDLDVDLLDHAAFEALHHWRVAHERTGGRVDMDQLHEAWQPTPERASPPTGRRHGEG